MVQGVGDQCGAESGFRFRVPARDHVRAAEFGVRRRVGGIDGERPAQAMDRPVGTVLFEERPRRSAQARRVSRRLT